MSLFINRLKLPLKKKKQTKKKQLESTLIKGIKSFGNLNLEKGKKLPSKPKP